jgi:hypothetical protein
MIRAPRLVPGNSSSPIHRLRLLRNLHRRAPLASFLAAQALVPARRIASSPLGWISLLMDPAVTAAAPAPSMANGDSGGLDDAAEFVDAVAGGEDGGVSGLAAGGEEEPRELPEELFKGVVCLECETSPEAEAAGMGRTCRVYIVGTAHVSQVRWCDDLSTDMLMFELRS